MSLPIIRLKAAREDIVEIGVYLMGENPNAAGRFLTSLEKTLQNLAAMPEMGITHQVGKHELRRFRVSNFNNYLIFYRLLDDRLELVRIIHGARDIPSLLEDL